MMIPQPNEVYEDKYGGVCRIHYATKSKVVFNWSNKEDLFAPPTRVSLRMKVWRWLAKKSNLRKRRA